MKKEESKVIENIIIEVSNAESMYKILKNLLLWKYEILQLYSPFVFDTLYCVIQELCNSWVLKQHMYVYFNTLYHWDYDRLRYGKYGNWNWKLYKNIKKQLNNLKSNYKFIFLNIPEEMEFIQKFHYALSQVCNTCQSDCEYALKGYHDFYERYTKFIDTLSDSEKQETRYVKLNEDMKKNLLGEGCLACFSCCIPGICFGYPYAGKKWCDEKVKNEELSRKEI